MQRLLVFSILLLFTVSSYGQQPFWKQTSGPEGAIITALACSQNDNVFALTSNNVLFRSTDGGGSWQDITSGLSGTSPLTLISSPEGTIYVTTVRNGAVLFNRSLNNGDSWISTQPGTITSVIDIKASFGSTLYMVGSVNGSNVRTVFKSGDYGNFWTQINGNLSPNASFVHLSIASNNDLFLDAGNYYYRSSDNGNSWTMLVNNISRGTGMMTSKKGVLYTLPGFSSYWSANIKMVRRSTDNGRTWDSIADNCATIGMVSDSILLCLQSDTLLSSVDYGKSWTILKHESLIPFIYNSTTEPSRTGASDSKGHCYLTASAQFFVYDQTSGILRDLSVPFSFVNTVLAIDKNQVLVSTPSGISRSTDKGSHWSIDPYVNRYDTSELSGLPSFSFAKDSSGGIFCYSQVYTILGQGGIFRSTNDGQSWKPKLSSFGQSLFNTVRFSTAPNGNIFALWLQSPFQILRSGDLGTTWDQVVEGLPGDFPVDITCDNTGVLYTALNQDIYRSVDSGASWQFEINLIDPILYKNVVSTSIVTCLATTSKGEVFAGTSHDGVIVSNDHGVHWQVAGDYLDSTNISALFAAPNGDIFAFTKFGKLDSGIIYKQYNSTHWVTANSGLGYVGDLATMTFGPDGTAYLGTNGRGVWIGSGIVRSTRVAQSVPTALSLNIFPNPAAQQAKISYAIPTAEFITIELFNELGQKILTLMNGNQSAGEYQIDQGLGKIPNGMYFVRLSTPDGNAVERLIVRK